MKSGKQIPDKIKDKLDEFEETFQRYKGDYQEKFAVLKTVNSRWQVALLIDLGEMTVLYTWKKPDKILIKEQRLAVLREMARIGMCDKLTQKSLSEMLRVSTSTIQASLAELADADKKPTVQADLP